MLPGRSRGRMDTMANPFLRPNESDDAIDAALDEAAKSKPAPPSDVPLKRQWDADLEAELEKALEGFDASKYEVATPRRERSNERANDARRDRGQETRQG